MIISHISLNYSWFFASLENWLRVIYPPAALHVALFASYLIRAKKKEEEEGVTKKGCQSEKATKLYRHEKAAKIKMFT